MHCRTVDDEGVAGLTQETLQEPEVQKKTSKQNKISSAFTLQMFEIKRDKEKRQDSKQGKERETKRTYLCVLLSVFDGYVNEAIHICVLNGH